MFSAPSPAASLGVDSSFHSSLFTDRRHPQTGVVSHVLTRRVAPIQQRSTSPTRAGMSTGGISGFTAPSRLRAIPIRGVASAWRISTAPPDARSSSRRPCGTRASRCRRER